jgi:hypothetical protein
MTYSKFITLKKGFYQLIMAMIAGALTAGISQIEAIPQEQAPTTFVILLVLLKMAENYLKHKYD